MVAAAVEEDVGEVEYHAEGPIVVWFDHAAYAVMGENPIESVGVVGKGKVDVETGKGGLLLNGVQNGVGVLESRGADGQERSLSVKADGICEVRFWPEIINRCRLDEIRDPEVKTAERVVAKDAVNREVWSDAVEGEV